LSRGEIRSSFTVVADMRAAPTVVGSTSSSRAGRTETAGLVGAAAGPASSGDQESGLPNLSASRTDLRSFKMSAADLYLSSGRFIRAFITIPSMERGTPGFSARGE